MLRPRTLCFAAVSAWLALSGVASGQPAQEPTPAQIRAAAEAFDLGREAYQRQEYVGAAEQFERADSQAPSSTALEYAIRAREKAGQIDRAATLAVLGRERHPDDANLQKLIPQLIERAKRDLFELTITCSEPCELAVTSKIVHGAPSLTRVLYLTEGSHAVRAGFSADRSASRDVQATAGGQGSIVFETPAAAAEAPVSTRPAPTQETAPLPAEPRSGGWSPAVFWVGAGLTAAAGAATIWSGVDTLNNPGEERVRQECARDDESCALYQEGLSAQRRTNVLIGVTAGLGLGTVLVGLLATDWGGTPATDSDASPALKGPAKRKTARAGFEPWFGVGETTIVGARGRF
jgi:hypothetical protein